MVNFGTSAAGSIPRAANEVVFEAAPDAGRDVRGQRIQKLREAIEGGQYRVCSAELADALLRAARQAN